MATNTNLVIEIAHPEWLKDILVDPISKSNLKRQGNTYISELGFSYCIKEGIPDFRIRLNQFEKDWQKGQESYEKWMEYYLNNAEKNNSFYPKELERDAPMYEKLVLEGRVLDVGGNLGAIRKYMKKQQQHVSIDPFINVNKLATGKVNFFKTYPMHIPLNFIAGFAEFLPFKSASFDTVNMRSCIDHFFNPELSLLETHRVLKENGKVIIGMTVKVNSVKNTLKENARIVLNLFTSRFEDNHIWHPTRDELISMFNKCGFHLEDEVWQNENVWYSSFRKISDKLVDIT